MGMTTGLEVYRTRLNVVQRNNLGNLSRGSTNSEYRVSCGVVWPINKSPFTKRMSPNPRHYI
jgi:hypothetical protein